MLSICSVSDQVYSTIILLLARPDLSNIVKHVNDKIIEHCKIELEIPMGSYSNESKFAHQIKRSTVTVVINTVTFSLCIGTANPNSYILYSYIDSIVRR